MNLIFNPLICSILSFPLIFFPFHKIKKNQCLLISITGEYNDRCLQNDHAERCSLDDDNSTENYNCSDEYSNECHHQNRDNEYTNQYYNDGHQQMNYSDVAPTKGPELLYKSTKELYKVVARECGITCKMTDTCR